MNSKPPPTPFAAVLLAGGRSVRMGRDKAELIVAGRPLWQRQLEKLRALEPAELFISGRADGPYAGAGVEVVADAVPNLGPLAGIAAAFRRSTMPLLLVLAIDLPDITRGMLAALVAAASHSGNGVLPRSERRFEPLAAVYPRRALPLAEEALPTADRSLQSFVERLIAGGLASLLPLEPAQIAEFRNVNTPAVL